MRMVDRWLGQSRRTPFAASVRVADHTSEAGARTIGRFGQLEVLSAAMNPSTLPLMVRIATIRGCIGSPKAGERTKGARPPNEDIREFVRRYGELRLSIAQVGRGAPPSKSISMSVREFANAGNVIAVLRSVVSITSPESPTNTYRPSRL